jgi:hypothetical protein
MRCDKGSTEDSLKRPFGRALLMPALALASLGKLISKKSSRKSTLFGRKHSFSYKMGPTKRKT